MASTDHQPYDGPERRRYDRTQATPSRVLGRARVRGEHVRHLVALTPGEWYPVIEQPADVMSPPLEGYIWIDLDGRPRSLWAAFLEIQSAND